MAARIKKGIEEDREALLRRDGLLIGIVGASMLNGMHFSPLFDPAMLLLRAFAPAFFSASPLLMLYFTSLFLATATILVSGVPAALFERFTAREQSDAASLGIWLASAITLALPAFAGLLGTGRV